MESLPAPTPQSRGAEKQLAPGVYFTPAPSKSGDANGGEDVALEAMGLEELQRERAATLRSVEMLRSSNAQMREFDPRAEDPELVQAIGENIAVVLRREQRVRELEVRIRALDPRKHFEDALSAEGVVDADAAAAPDAIAAPGATADSAVQGDHDEESAEQNTSDNGMFL